MATEDSTSEATSELIASLSVEQQDIIKQFKEISNLSTEASFEALLNSDWRIESALNKLFNPAVPNNTIPPPVVGPVRRRRPGNEVRPGVSYSNAVSPRRIPPNEEHFLVKLLWLPFRALFTTLSFSSSVFNKIVSYVFNYFNPPITDPIGDVKKFIDMLKDTQVNSPDFQLETQVAITRKAKEQVKMLLVYLHGNKDTESRDFISKILSNDEVIGQMNSNFILWGCSVATPEGNGVMRKFRASKVPFTIIMCPKDNKMVVVAKIKNVLDAQDYLSRLRSVVQNNKHHVEAIHKTKADLLENQRIREAQDEAYQQALLQDQEKARKKREEVEEKERKEKLKRERRELKQQKMSDHEMRRAICLSEIEKEPKRGSENCYTFRIHMLDGKKIQRNFHGDDSIKKLHDFVYADSSSLRKIIVSKTFPRQQVTNCSTNEIDEGNSSLATIATSNLVNMETLMVESQVSDDESSTDEDESS